MTCFAKKNIIKPILVRLLVFGIIFCIMLSARNGIFIVRTLPDNLVLSEHELSGIDINNISCVVSSGGATADKNQKNRVKLKFKLFNLFTLKTVNAVVEPGRKAYLGGYPIGLSIKARGVIVASRAEINTCAGRVTPLSEVREGDIITKMNGEPVLYVSEIIERMAEFTKNDRFIEFKVLRGGKEVSAASYPVIEELTGFYKLGIAVRDCAEGVGTLSYIKEDGRFGSLGHSICGPDNSVVECMEGQVYDCKLVGYNKGERGSPGELKGSFANVQNPIGKIEENNDFGVYGRLYKSFSDELYEIGSRFSVKNGKAQIRTTINDKPVFYDVEIIKSISQNSPQEKGMIVRVTDKRLLNTTGGILQGMSGSPLIQNGKIVGALTHVMLSDPTKGYAVYLDFMYSN